MAKFFGIPFATTGDRDVIPDAVQGDGSVSYTQGFGFDYERPNTDPNYKPVPREGMNGLYFDITDAIGEIQKNGVATWDTNARPYALGALVRSGTTVWRSLVTNNNATPAEGASWTAIGVGASESIAGVAAIATTVQAQALTNDSVIMTPAKMPAALGIMKGIFRATSNTSWTVPAGVTRVWLSGCGGGGGGGGAGGANSSNTGSGGGGGGAGRPVIREQYTVVPGATIGITIGAAGSGGNGSSAGNTASNGTAGGNTVITGLVGGTVTLQGGGGGGGGRSTTSGAAGGLSPSTGYPIGMQGEDSNVEGVPTGNGGDGGGGPFGAQGHGAAATPQTLAPGYDAHGYGCAGGGAGGVYGTGNGAKGGNGAPGIVILEW